MSDTLKKDDIIGTEPASKCYLCGEIGVMLYEGLADQWFGVPGLWNLKRCPNGECGLVWLDPMPSKEDIWKAYRSYFTHSDYSTENRQKYANFLDIFAVKICAIFYKLFMRAVGFRSKEKLWRAKGDTMFLGNGTPGNRLLDVGCGKGAFIARMRLHGWDAEGLEVDADAVKHARQINSLNIHLGTLESIQFQDKSFDVITLNHVIEHVHDPISLIRECLRILKVGGKLVLATPNIESFAHQIFGRNWSHLDSPRHLMLFTMKALSECVARAGFQTIDTWCVPGYAEGAIPASIEREEKADGKQRTETSKYIEAATLKIRAFYRFFINKEENAGEEIFLMATKEG